MKKDGNELHTKKALTILFTLLNLLWMSKATIRILNLMTNKKYAFVLNQNTIIILLLFGLISLVFFNAVNKKQSINAKYYFSTFLFIFILIISYLINFQSNYVANSQIVQLLKSYFPIIFVIIILVFNNLHFIDRKVMQVTVICYSTVQGTIGILQGITKSTIIPVTDDFGNSVVNSIYYSNGISSKEAYFLQNAGARVRAFGLTDSGLTLGLLCLLSLIILLYADKKGILHYIGIAFFMCVIFLTLTRTIMLITGIVIILYILKKENYLKIMYILSIVSQLAMIGAAAIILKSDFGANIIKIFPTIGSRLEGYLFYFDHYNFSFLHILFGNNNVSLSPLLQTAYSLDNESLNIIMDIGLLGLIMVLGVYTGALVKYRLKIDNRNDGIYIFLLTFPLLGMGNSVYYFYFPMLAIYLLLNSKRIQITKKLEDE